VEGVRDVSLDAGSPGTQVADQRDGLFATFERDAFHLELRDAYQDDPVPSMAQRMVRRRRLAATLVEQNHLT
jgi:hypothetical protein